ncbi:MAG: OmpA family protein [Bacteroidales bacterium]|nr:OmpA family protein [Bacteroidales bacterium]
MKKSIILVLALFSVYFSALSQRSESEIALKEYFIDAEFFLAQEFYIDALNDYLQVSRRGYEDNANINYRIGICYLNILGQKDKAIEYFEKARASVSLKYRESSLGEKRAPIDLYLYLGNAYRVNNKLDKAIDAYNTYKSLLPEEESELHSYASKQIEACNIASEFMKEPVDVIFTNLGPKINDSNENYKAVISGDGQTLVFMRRLPFYDAVYFSKKENGEWTEPLNITPQIMSDGNQFVSSLSYDGKLMFLTIEDEYNSDIMKTTYVDNRWTKSERLGSHINTKYWESHASISKDGRKLYFTSNRKGGIGGVDIYISELGDDGKWGEPGLMSDHINSDLNEDTPFICEDGKTLYYSSQGFTSMGGYDVFVTLYEGESGWSVPENLGYPLNTTDDDLFYYPWRTGAIGYMARLEEDGFGSTDIYEIRFPKQIEEVPITEAEVTRDTIIKAETPIVEELIEAVVKPEVEAEPETIQDTAVKTETPVVEEIIEAVTIPEPESLIKKVEIKPVFFAFDKSTLSDEGIAELNKILQTMNEFPDIKVQLTGYTDALGPAEYNIHLSERRAMSAMKYLITKGIDATRLSAVGKGETNFIAPNTKEDGSDDPEGRKYNRRVEFEISGIDSKTLIIKRLNPVPEKQAIK